MKLTPEERKQRAIDRKNEIKRCQAQFPYADLSSTSDESSCQVVMEAGKPGMELWKRGAWYQSQALRPWEKAWITLDNPAELATFIRALVARYNVLVAEMNDDASASRMAKADTIT